MKIETFVQVDFNDHWLICTRRGEIDTAPKDPVWLRWVKTAFQILTFYFYDVYGHVRINFVAQGLFYHFKKEREANPSCTDHYITLINKLLSLEHPIQTHREELIRVKNLILTLNFENDDQLS